MTEEVEAEVAEAAQEVEEAAEAAEVVPQESECDCSCPSRQHHQIHDMHFLYLLGSNSG